MLHSKRTVLNIIYIKLQTSRTFVYIKKINNEQECKLKTVIEFENNSFRELK